MAQALQREREPAQAPARFMQIRGVWRSPVFRLFLLGESARLAAYHAANLALPWLVLQHTGSPASLGFSILLSGIPRVALMALSGALVDRVSPGRVVVLSTVLRAVLFSLFALLSLAGSAGLAVLYTMCFALGLLDALFLPARGALLPGLVSPEQLKPANAAVAACEHLWGLAGPLAAGALIAALDPGTGAPSGASTLMIAAAAAAVAAVPLLAPFRSHKPRVPGSPTAPSPYGQPASPSLLRLILHRPGLRLPVLTVVLVNLLTTGPLWIGVPMLAASRFPHDPGAIGLLASAAGAGALAGAALAGILPLPGARQMARALVTTLCCLAAGAAVLLASPGLPLSALSILLLGSLTGYLNVTAVTQVQRATPPAFLGRMMGLLNLK